MGSVWRCKRVEDWCRQWEGRNTEDLLTSGRRGEKVGEEEREEKAKEKRERGNG